MHIEKHSVTREEVDELLFNTEPVLLENRQDKTCVMYGKLKSSGRYLKVYFRKKEEEKDMVYFVITAFDINEQMIIDELNKMIDY